MHILMWIVRILRRMVGSLTIRFLPRGLVTLSRTRPGQPVMWREPMTVEYAPGAGLAGARKSSLGLRRSNLV